MNDRFSADDLPRRAGSAPPRSPWPIDLAHVRPFRIADVEVRPGSREVLGSGRCEVLEPLVMQVLVTLASAKGEIFSRDDLIQACWGGRAVTDDAINRVLSRLRALAREFGGFTVETIIKVGYRLQVQCEMNCGADAPSEDSPIRGGAPIHRRALMAGGAAVAASAAGIVLWQQPWRHKPSPEAVRLFELGYTAQRQGVINQIRQAISYFERAVRIDPLYSKAWGALALAQTHILEGYGEPGAEGAPARLVSAARRALQLDPDNVDARLALILLKPFFRNWAVTEAELRDLTARYSDHWLARGRLANLLYDVGRLDEGIRIHDAMNRVDSMLPVRDALWANALLYAGRLDEAAAILDHAHDVWPAHPTLWKTRFKFLLFSGRPRAAAAFVTDAESRPSGLDPSEIDLRLNVASAAETGAPAARETSIGQLQRVAEEDVRNIPFAAGVFALLGRPDLTFASLERYYFNRGSFGRPDPITPMTRRYAVDLFAPPLAPLRSDPRFASLLDRVGLEAYWRQTRTVPDYRRRA
jgi:DNA-binding winged helix-turn-helix (wHTH) protein/tetratricopeptide (TPR) repeat protein